MTRTLRQRRIEKGWTLEQLGRQMGNHMKPKKPVKPGIVSGWELTGRCHPSVVPLLAKVFQISEQEAREMMEATEAAAKSEEATASK